MDFCSVLFFIQHKKSGGRFSKRGDYRGVFLPRMLGVSHDQKQLWMATHDRQGGSGKD